MASRKVRLVKYVKLQSQSSGWKYCPAIFYANHKLKPHAVKTPDGEQTIKDGQYYLSFGRRWEPVGNDPNEAVKALLRKRGELLAVANGSTVVQASPKVSEGTVNGTVKAAFAAWVQEFEDGGADSETVRIKRTVGREFQKSCKAKMLSAVTRGDCLRYINAYCKAKGNGDRTRYNQFLHLRQWLQFHKMNDHLTAADAPEYAEEDPIEIEDWELERFWKVCPNHKKLMYRVLLECGLRKAEIKTLRWIDIVGGAEPHIQVRERPEYKYTPKSHHCRDIGIKDELYAELMHRKMVSKHALVFHTRSGKPLNHFWDDVQVLFRKAGIDMRKAHIHSFRSTFCTTLLRGGMTLQDVMVAMGHSQVSSTMRYMAVLNRKAMHAKVTAVKFKVA